VPARLVVLDPVSSYHPSLVLACTPAHAEGRASILLGARASKNLLALVTVTVTVTATQFRLKIFAMPIFFSDPAGRAFAERSKVQRVRVGPNEKGRKALAHAPKSDGPKVET